jgi:phosphatidylserine/phosphatidylglycerophosphate/cardiolipin synthase-like enzyme
MDIVTQKNRYFLAAADANPPTLPAPTTYANSKVTPLIGCAEFVAQVEAALAKVGTKTPDENKEQFILVHNWCLGLEMGPYVPPPDVFGSVGGTQLAGTKFYLDGLAATPTRILADVLKEKAKAGVDVRVLGWVSFAVVGSKLAMQNGAGFVASVSTTSMTSIQDLRSEPTLATGAALNVLGHTAGAVHTKLVVIGDATEAVGFTGGLDFAPNRWSRMWHDVTAMVEGPAVQGLYDWFQLIWNENAGREPKIFDFGDKKMPTTAPGTGLLKARTLATTSRGKHHVQSMRTVPVFKYAMFNVLPENRAPAAAPNGLFEIKAAWEKAVRGATDYIYMEDQSLWSVEVFGWANAAIKANPTLRVILLTSGGADPDDPVMPGQEILTLSLDKSLLAGLSPTQRDQVRIFRRFQRQRYGPPAPAPVVKATDNTDGTSAVELDLAAPADMRVDGFKTGGWLLRVGANEFPIKANPKLTTGDKVTMTVENLGATTPVGAVDCLVIRYLGVTVHSKTTLVDDHWAIIGSANCTRRSLYTDWEHSVVFVDEDDAAVKAYRKKLWAFHFNEANVNTFDNLANSLYRWEPTWGADGGFSGRPVTIVPVTLPINGPELGLFERKKYELFLDADSRQAWGALL